MSINYISSDTLVTYEKRLLPCRNCGNKPLVLQEYWESCCVNNDDSTDSATYEPDADICDTGNYMFIISCWDCYDNIAHRIEEGEIENTINLWNSWASKEKKYLSWISDEEHGKLVEESYNKEESFDEYVVSWLQNLSSLWKWYEYEDDMNDIIFILEQLYFNKYEEFLV